MKRLITHIKISCSCNPESFTKDCEKNKSLNEKKLSNTQVKSLLLAGLFLFFLIIIPAVSNAATKTWTGNTSTDWTLGSNWGGTAPVAGDIVLIPGGRPNYPVITTAVTVASINVNNASSGATLTVAAGGSLTLSGAGAN